MLRELLVCELFLLLIPIAAYPLREILPIGKDRRKGQRSTASQWWPQKLQRLKKA